MQTRRRGHHSARPRTRGTRSAGRAAGAAADPDPGPDHARDGPAAHPACGPCTAPAMRYRCPAAPSAPDAQPCPAPSLRWTPWMTGSRNHHCRPPADAPAPRSAAPAPRPPPAAADPRGPPAAPPPPAGPSAHRSARTFAGPGHPAAAAMPTVRRRRPLPSTATGRTRHETDQPAADRTLRTQIMILHTHSPAIKQPRPQRVADHPGAPAASRQPCTSGPPVNGHV